MCLQCNSDLGFDRAQLALVIPGDGQTRCLNLGLAESDDVRREDELRCVHRIVGEGVGEGTVAS